MGSKAMTDVFGLMMGADEIDDNVSVERKNTYEALVDCLNNKSGLDKDGCINMKYLMSVTGLPVSKIAEELRGIIFQDPERVMELDRYDAKVGWVVSDKYLSGNVRKSLTLAKRANIRFRNKFTSNIIALKNILPEQIGIDDIHINLGASWIPEEEIAEFIYEFFHLTEIPEVIYRKELGRWEIKLSPVDDESIFNRITYGVIDESNVSYMNKPKQYLTGAEIIEHALNAKPIKVYDYVPKTYNSKGEFEYEQIFNRNKTIEAQEKEKAITEAFRDWVCADKTRADNFEAYYNETFVGYAHSPYDGSFLKLPDLNREVTLYPHQKNAVARVLLSGKNVVFCHDVGTGKTYEIIVSVHELKRLGLSSVNMVVVPNNILKATVDTHRYLYPDDKIFVVTPSMFSPAKRADALAEMRDGDYTAIYIAYSSFDMIVMGKQYYVDKYEDEIIKLKRASFNSDSKFEKKKLASKIKKLQKKLEKFITEEKDTFYLTYDKLGVTTLAVDESHNYKNIPIQSATDNIVGMSKNGSKKCREMLEKVHNTDRIIFASGTILTNSLADLFTFQSYLQPRTLEAHRIDNFNAWINTFGQRETSFECDVDCNSKTLRTVTRFTSFHNLGELMSLFSQVCDFHHIDEKEEGLPKFSGYVNICIPKSKLQAEYINSLSERTEKIRTKKVKRTEDNLLKVTTDGRKAALDIRLVDENAVIEKGEKTKINVCADKVAELYYKYRDSVQIVFSDIGTPKASFNVYDALREELIDRGIAPEEIAYVHDATTEAARTKLFKDMNSAKLKVVIGSTQKLGVGVNVQEKLVALHHLSVPWRPSDMVQREGRILRKGNTSEEVFIIRYITEGTFDAYSWQRLESKQRFICDFISGTSFARSMEDIADIVLDYAEVKALAIGSINIKKRVEVSNLLDRERIKSRARQIQLQKQRAVIEASNEEIKADRISAEIAAKDYEEYTERKEKVPNPEREAFGEELLYALRHNDYLPEDRFFNNYQGFSVMLPAEMDIDHPYVIITSENGGRYFCEMSADKTPRGCTKTIDSLLDHLNDTAEKLYIRIEELYKRIEAAEADLDKGNSYLEKIEELKAELQDIDALIEAELNEEVA